MKIRSFMCYLIIVIIFVLLSAISYGQETVEGNNDEVKYKAVFAGVGYSTALKEDGTVVAWGYNEDLDDEDRCDVPFDLKNVKSISVGGAHTIALKEDGTIVAWGDNRYGQCNVPQGLKNVKAISAGEVHSIAIKEDGTIVAWGDNIYKQCEIPPGLRNVKSVAAGMAHTVALKENGTVVAWGGNYYGQCNINGFQSVEAIEAGFYNTLALMQDGTVEGFGECYVPRGINNIEGISSSDRYFAFLDRDGTLEIYGIERNPLYGGARDYLLKELKSVKSVSCGRFHISALKTDGTIENVSCVLNNDTLSISGNISSDIYDLYKSQYLNEGFEIEVIEVKEGGTTNKDGKFRIPRITKALNSYSVKISKPGYLTRYINNINTESSGIMFGTINYPLIMFAGDINEDDTINLSDVIKLTKAFNTNSSDEGFDATCDINKDNQINLIDAMIIARNFNMTSDYNISSGSVK